jgi:hypothetical protein
MREHTPNVLLKGGPVTLRESRRVMRVDNTEEHVKIPMGNGYEHFAPTGELVETDEGALHVFEWDRRTRIAE